MRVIAGLVGGRRLKSLKGGRLRPTADRVKESLFGILGEQVRDASVLDLYAGAGGLGIEALSRGAKCAFFVDHYPLCVKVIRENLESLGLLNKAQVLKAEVFKSLKILSSRQVKFNLIFLDPPYLQGLAKKTLRILASSDIILQDGIVVAEHHRQEDVPLEVGRLKLIRQERYGDTLLSFYAVH